MVSHEPVHPERRGGLWVNACSDSDIQAPDGNTAAAAHGDSIANSDCNGNTATAGSRDTVANRDANSVSDGNSNADSDSASNLSCPAAVRGADALVIELFLVIRH